MPHRSRGLGHGQFLRRIEAPPHLSRGRGLRDGGVTLMQLFYNLTAVCPSPPCSSSLRWRSRPRVSGGANHLAEALARSRRSASHRATVSSPAFRTVNL